ncbi:hypothetical protein GCM10019016_104620 [Streptomyces prasinosporus]|uniref:Transposase Helix-turn-helix domain-containing protein n=1 Tax=Streptomyces prasinosporus TaxID=68256 RepID=A0ABP6U9I7_9ACTN
MLSGCGDETGPLVVGVVIRLATPATERALLAPCPATLDVPHELVEHAAGCCTNTAGPATRRRKLGCFDQALLTLVHLRKNETFSQLGASLGTSQTTAWRYVDEALDVLASWAPGLHGALTGLGEGDHVTVDGTPIPTESPPTGSARTSRTTRRSTAGTA